jgi:hypothetical protein
VQGLLTRKYLSKLLPEKLLPVNYRTKFQTFTAFTAE